MNAIPDSNDRRGFPRRLAVALALASSLWLALACETFAQTAVIVSSCPASRGLTAGGQSFPAIDTNGNLCLAPGSSLSTVTANQGAANATPWNENIVQWAGQALGAMANYGTSPGAVLVPGVNAFVTNTVPVTGTFWQATQPVSAASLPLPTGAAQDATVATTNTDLGPPGATACATDTGSCSLNALIQRLAQRLTTINTTLGSPFQAGSSLAANQSVNHAQVAGTATSVNNGAADAGTQRVALAPNGNTTTMATAAPTTPTFSSILAASGTRKSCLVQNTGTTTAYIYFGATGSATTGNSFQLSAGQSISCQSGNITLTDNIAATCASGTCAFVIASQ